MKGGLIFSTKDFKSCRRCFILYPWFMHFTGESKSEKERHKPVGKNNSMRILNNTIFFFAITILLGCNQTSPPGEPQEDARIRETVVPEQVTEIRDLRPELVLGGGYATSELIESEWFRLFDDDPGTVWESKLGTGPGEKIGVSFLGEGAWIGKLILGELEQDSSAIIDEINIFINDELFRFGSIRDTFLLDTLVKDLSIEFAKAGELNYKKFEQEEEQVSIGIFPRDQNIGLRYLLLQDTAGNEYRTLPPRIVKGRLAPSSNLNPLAIYHAGHLFDSKREFAWIEGSEGSGSGDSISIQFEEPQCISKLMIWNGWQASPAKFEANARIKTLHFKPLEDTSRVFFRLKDAVEPSSLLLHKNRSQNWVLKILDIYPGNVTRDLVISELLLFDCEDQPFVVNSGLKEQFQNEMLSQAEGTPLSDILDTYIFNIINSDPDNQYTQKSIVLHADGSFCAASQQYLTQIDMTSDNQIDGYWGILEANEEIARLKLLGRWKSKNDPNTLLTDRDFEEELIIKKGQIEGGPTLGQFYTE